jgi:hypothetical protein
MEIKENRIEFKTPFGINVLYMPSQFIRGDSEEDLQVFNYYASVIQKIEEGEGSSIILPSDRDEGGKLLFELVQPVVNITLPSINYIEKVGDVMIATKDKPQEEINND